MTNAVIDNSVNEELGNVILWQYDKAKNLIGMINMLQSFHDTATKGFWDSWQINVFNQFVKNADGTYKYEANDFGLSVWGTVIGCPRPDITIDNETQTISSDFYRRLLEGKMNLINSNHSDLAIADYLNTVYQGRYTFTDNYDMSLTFLPVDGVEQIDEETALAEQHPNIAFVWPAAVYDAYELEEQKVFCFEGQTPDPEYNDPAMGTFDESHFCSPSFVSTRSIT